MADVPVASALARSRSIGGRLNSAPEFQQGIEDMFYCARQFCIRDLNGYQLYFIGDRD